MRLRILLFVLLVFLLTWLSCKKSEQVANLQRPKNVLLLTLDTTRADHLGCYGYGQSTSPNLDKLAARGVRFDQAVATIPLTRPSHASMLTGLLPHRHGIWSNGPYRLEPEHKTLAEKLSGFRTGAVISSFVLTSSFGLNRGFTFFDDRLQEVPGEDPEKKAGQVVTAAKSWLEQDSRSFFLWLHFYDPHYPYEPPEPFRSRFAGNPYDGEIAFMDDAIGQILTFLQSKQRLDDTLVIAVADHGEGLGEHGEDTHGYFLYDNTVRVPLILAGPGVDKGKTVSQVVSVMDVYSTVLDAEGVTIAGVDGRSLWPLLRGDSLARSPVLVENRSIHYQFGWARIAGIRTEGWKWLDSPVPELYDLTKDPGENQNLAQSQPSKAAEFKKLWSKMQPAASLKTNETLTPEEEEKLESLGYVSSGPAGTSELEGPDAKQFAKLTAAIEQVIRDRQRNRTMETEPVIRKILASDPGNIFALRVLGELLLEQGKPLEALEVLKKLSSSYENHPETLAFLATAYERTGDLKNAADHYQKATSSPWIYWPALESLARLSIKMPNLVSRDALLNKMNGLSPESYRERIPIARAYAILAQWQKAMHWYQQALEKNSSGSEALVGSGQMLLKLGETARAIETLNQVRPPTTESLFVLATALEASGESRKACERYKESFQLNPTNINLLLGLSAGLRKCGETELAAQAHQRTLRTKR